MTRNTRFSLMALALVSGSAAAQAPARDSVTAVAKVEAPAVAAPLTAPEATSKRAGPTLESASVGVKATHANDPLAPKPVPAETRRNEAMMIVGGVAFVAGAIIGDRPGAIIMVGGFVVGIIGLYRYLE